MSGRAAQAPVQLPRTDSRHPSPVGGARGPRGECFGRGNVLRGEVGIWLWRGWAKGIPDCGTATVQAASMYDGLPFLRTPVSVPWRPKGAGHVAAAGLLLLRASELNISVEMRHGGKGDARLAGTGGEKFTSWGQAGVLLVMLLHAQGGERPAWESS